MVIGAEAAVVSRACRDWLRVGIDADFLGSESSQIQRDGAKVDLTVHAGNDNSDNTAVVEDIVIG